MYPKEKQKLYILFGIFAIAALLVYYSLLLRPQFLSFIVRNREFRAINARVRGAEALIASEQGMKMQHENLLEQSKAVEKRLPAQDEISSLLGGFSSIAESSGVKILKIKPLEVLDDISQAGAGVQLYSEFPILIEARAGYHQCGIFINKLENMERFIKIEDIDISGRPTDPRHHDIRLRAVTYIMQ